MKSLNRVGVQRLMQEPSNISKFMSRVPLIVAACALAAVIIAGLSSRKLKHEYAWTKEPVSGENHSTGHLTPADVIELLRNVRDPEIDINVVDLGLIYKVDSTGDAVTVTMTLTTPSCSYGPELIADVKKELFKQNIRSLRLTITFDPPWTTQKIAPEAFRQLFTQARSSK